MQYALEVYDAEVDECGLATPARFIRVASGGRCRTTLAGGTAGTLEDWTEADAGRLVLVTRNRAEVVTRFWV